MNCVPWIVLRRVIEICLSAFIKKIMLSSIDPRLVQMNDIVIHQHIERSEERHVGKECRE